MYQLFGGEQQRGLSVLQQQQQAMVSQDSFGRRQFASYCS